MIRKIWGCGVTLAIAAVAGWIVWGEYQHYVDDPWTRDGQVRANVVGIAPRVSGPIIRIAVIDNQRGKRGDLLVEIDPADYQAAVDLARAAGDTIFLADADATTYPSGVPGLFSAIYPNGVNITGGTGRFAGAHGNIASWGAVDQNTGQIVLRYQGTIFFAPQPL